MDFDQTCTDTLIFGTAERNDEILVTAYFRICPMLYLHEDLLAGIMGCHKINM